MTGAPGWVLRRYDMLPTDRRFLELTPLECELERESDALWAAAQRRHREGLPVRGLEDLTLEEDFDSRLAALVERDKASDAEIAARPPDNEKVIDFRPKLGG